MFDYKELDRRNFLTWLAHASVSEIEKAKKEHKEKFERLYKEYVLETSNEGVLNIENLHSQ